MYTEDTNPGPEIKRRCTDAACLIIFSVYVAGFATLYKYLSDHSKAEVLSHGYDHCGNLCGVDNADLKKKYVFYPDLQREMDLKHKLHQYYGICVETCPDRNAVEDDYECHGGPKEGFRDKIRSSWFVSFPTFPLAGRCMPYEPGPIFSDSPLKLCADPPCAPTMLDAAGMPTSAQGVCGLNRDRTAAYWLLDEPDEEMKEGWKSEANGTIPEAVMAERIRLAKEGRGPTCNLTVLRDTRIRLMTSDNENNALHELITKYTGAAFRVAKTLYHNWNYVLGLGILCALVTALLTVTFFTCCVRVVMILLLVLLFATLVVVDYILFFQAGMVTGRTGRDIIHTFEQHTDVKLPDCLAHNLEVKSQVENMIKVYEYSAYGVAVFTLVLVCVVFAMRKNFKTMIALFNEAARTIRHMPSMLLCPVLLLSSVVLVAYMTLYVYLAASMMDPGSLTRMMTAWNEHVPWLRLDDFGNMDNVKQAYGWALLFSFVWFYFFHVAVFTLVTALCVSHWYFYRNDPTQCGGTGWRMDMTEGWYPGRPVALAFFRVVRYHLGTAVMGSLLMTLVTMPRIILEYINSQSHADANPVMKGIIWCSRCCLWCLQNCVQFLTEYAYVYSAVTGSGFWSSARKSFQLIAKYPVQVALDKMMSRVLGFLACLTIPLAMGIAAFFVVKGEKAACALAIVPLAYITTRLVVGVYDVCVTTLFVCVMRDAEQFGGKYMSDRLLQVCGVQTGVDDSMEMRVSRIQTSY